METVTVFACHLEIGDTIEYSNETMTIVEFDDRGSEIVLVVRDEMQETTAVRFEPFEPVEVCP